MQHVIRQLRSQRSRHCNGNEKLSGIDGKCAIETFWGNSHDGRRLSVQAKRLSHGVRRGVEAIAPETITDYHNGRVTGLVEFRAENSSALRLHTKDRKIVGRDKLSEDAVGFCIHIT